MRQLHQLKTPLFLAATFLALVGCGSGSDAGDAATRKTITQADIDKVPPVAKEHVSEMNDYAKAMDAAHAGQAKGR